MHKGQVEAVCNKCLIVSLALAFANAPLHPPGSAEDEARTALQDGAGDRGAAEDHRPERRGRPLPGGRRPAAAPAYASGILPVQQRLPALSRGRSQAKKQKQKTGLTKRKSTSGHNVAASLPS